MAPALLSHTHFLSLASPSPHHSSSPPSARSRPRAATRSPCTTRCERERERENGERERERERASERERGGRARSPKPCAPDPSHSPDLHFHSQGTLTDGTKFDSSRDRGTPFDFTLGAGQVIKGWDQGLVGACVGEVRKLQIPPSLGYGDAGAGGLIPGGATLIFDTEVVGIN